MRILLNECVNQRMRNHLVGHECESARYAGFGGLKNGELLDAAEAAGFDVLVTVDRGFRYEQNLAGRKNRSRDFPQQIYCSERLVATCS